MTGKERAESLNRSKILLKTHVDGIRKVSILSACYLVFALGYSLIGFLQPIPAAHIHEYSPTRAILELGGHVLFGLIAALPLMDFDLILLSGAIAVLIDVDHIWTAFSFNVSNRPDHSIVYVLLASLAIFYAGTRLGYSKKRIVKLSWVPLIAFLSHLSYDVFAAFALYQGRGSSFPLFIPFNFGSISFGFYDFLPLELAAVSVSLIILLIANGSRQFRRPIE